MARGRERKRKPMQSGTPDGSETSEPVAAPPACTKIAKTEERGITIPQLRAVLQIVEEECSTWTDMHTGSPNSGAPLNLPAAKINLHHTNDHIIKPRTREHRCSYVELVAAGPQRPKWFVSHWWGEAVIDFVRCLEQHTSLRHLKPGSAYWVCAYANNQHETHTEIGEDPAESSFRKAMALADGTLSVVDREAMTFNRIWCSYEVTVTLDSGGAGGKLYDIATASDGNAVVLTDGVVAEDWVRGSKPVWKHRGGEQGHKLSREKAFPLSVFDRAFGARLENGAATQEDDRRRILNSIVGRSLGCKPLSSHPKYEEANASLQWRLGMGFLLVASEAGLVHKYDLLNLQEPAWKDVVCKAYEKLASALHTLVKYDLALHFYEKILVIKQKTLGEENEQVAVVYNNMANLQSGQSRYEPALELYKKALEIRRKVHGESHALVAAIYNNMANTYNLLFQHDLALQFYEKALEIRLRAFGEWHKDVGATYNNMANVYNVQSKHDLALEFYEKALAIRRKALGDDDPNVGATYNNMGNVYKGQSKYDLALEFYEKALAIRRKALGADHPYVGATCNNLAHVYNHQTRYDLALKFYQKALAIRRKAFGFYHADVGSTYNNIATVYLKQSMHYLALQYYEQALMVKREVLGEDHPEVGTTYAGMANVYTGQSKHDLALRFHDKALEMKRKALGEDHPDVAGIYHDLGKVYNNMSEHEVAMEYYQKALAIRRKTLGESHAAVGETCYDMALLLHGSQGEHGRSLEYSEKAAEIFVACLGSDHPKARDAMRLQVRSEGRLE